MHRKPLVLIGGGGHCKSCIDVIESIDEWQIIGILDKNSDGQGEMFGYLVLGGDDLIDEFVRKGYYFLITVGQLTTPVIRGRLFEKLENRQALIATITSANAYVSKYTKIGQGSSIHHFTVINANASIEDNCIINT